MARFADIRQFGAIAPFLGIGGQADEIARAAVGRAGPHAAAVAHDGDAQGAVGRVVGLDELQHFAPDLRRIMGQFDVQGRGIAVEPRPVAVPREGDAAGNTQGTEDPPAGKQTDLAGSQT